MAKQLTVEVWSDIACPWCFVGKRRLEAALAQFEHRDHVRVVWRAFELDPSAPAVRDGGTTYAQRLGQKYGASIQQAQGMIDRMVQTARADGLAFDFEHIQPGNTFHAHRLLHLAHERGVQDAVKERFFRAYLEQGEKIGDVDTLRRLAVDAGLDEDEVVGLLETDLYAEQVRGDEREAKQIGVDGVPFFLLGRRYAVPGAQPAELLLSALQKTWDELPETFVSLAGEEAEGPVCGPDGCA